MELDFFETFYTQRPHDMLKVWGINDVTLKFYQFI